MNAVHEARAMRVCFVTLPSLSLRQVSAVTSATATSHGKHE
jgi:hypothetical protein